MPDFLIYSQLCIIHFNCNRKNSLPSHFMGGGGASNTEEKKKLLDLGRVVRNCFHVCNMYQSTLNNIEVYGPLFINVCAIFVAQF